MTHDHGSCLESMEWVGEVLEGFAKILPNYIHIDWIPREPNHGINDVIFFLSNLKDTKSFSTFFLKDNKIWSKIKL